MKDKIQHLMNGAIKRIYDENYAAWQMVKMKDCFDRLDIEEYLSDFGFFSIKEAKAEIRMLAYLLDYPITEMMLVVDDVQDIACNLSQYRGRINHFEQATGVKINF